MQDNEELNLESEESFRKESGREWYIPTHARRAVKIYPLSHSELLNISSLNTTVSLMFSAGVGLATFALGLYTNSILVEQLNERAETIVWVSVPTLAVLAAVCFLVSGIAFKSKRSAVKSIIEESNISGE